ncbi:MAG: DNA repair protein RecN [Planctomycetota bacterium]|nr:DNA repair protein RecN [Planctomycetota bacterium]
MLRELHISNLAVISDVRIEFDHGLNCFTGATGAGKSLVIGAIELLLGLRSPAEMLRPGVDEGRVSGLFEITVPADLKSIEALTDVPVAEMGGELLITRKLYASGRTSVSVNGHPVTLAMLRQVGERLVDVHGQHDHQYLLRPSNQIEVLDQFGDLAAIANEYRAAFNDLVAAHHRIEQLSGDHALRQQRMELYRFSAEEIDAAQLDAREFAELESRASVLQNLEKLKKETSAAQAAMYETDGAILDRLKMVSAVLADLAILDSRLGPIATGVRDATIQLEDSAYDLARYLDKLDLDPAELVEVNDRLNAIHRILKKYGDNIDVVLAYRGQIGKDIADLEKQSDDLSDLTSQLAPLRSKVRKLGNSLTQRRKAAADKLFPRVEKNLRDLGMEKAKFSIEFSPATGAIPGDDVPATASGFDAVEFIIQTNPGQLAQPLRKIVSGGELSRIMLALKGILAASDRMSVLVFDEIDANVGGRLGAVIGEKLRSLARHHQVLCITHLPQIASFADRHFTVQKMVDKGQTESTVRKMEGPDRIQELAEMIGGAHPTETTRAQARELLAAANKPAGGSSGDSKSPSKSPRARSINSRSA